MQEMRLSFNANTNAKRSSLTSTTAKKPRKKSAYINRLSKSNGLTTLSRGLDCADLIEGGKAAHNDQESK